MRKLRILTSLACFSHSCCKVRVLNISLEVGRGGSLEPPRKCNWTLPKQQRNLPSEKIIESQVPLQHGCATLLTLFHYICPVRYQSSVCLSLIHGHYSLMIPVSRGGTSFWSPLKRCPRFLEWKLWLTTSASQEEDEKVICAGATVLFGFPRLNELRINTCLLTFPSSN